MTKFAQLKDVGFSDKELKVYTTLLGLGSASVRRIAEASGINRGTTYDILKSLMKEGMVSYFHKEKKQYFVAEDPHKIENLLERRQKKLDSLKSELSDLVPMLKALQGASDAKPVVKYYEGKAGVRAILNDVLDATATDGRHYYVYSTAHTRERLYEEYHQYSAERIRRGITVKVIAFGKGGELRGLDERKWITTKETASTYTIIYAGKVALLAEGAHKEVAGVLIEHQAIYHTQRIIFEQLWARL